MHRDGDGLTTGPFVSAVEFVHVQEVGELAQTILAIRAVAFLGVEVVPPHLARFVPVAAGVDDARALGLFEFVQEQIRQRERSNVIDPELRFESVFGLLHRRHHEARVVDEQIQPRLTFHLLRRRLYRQEVAEIDVDDVDVRAREVAEDLSLGLLGFAPRSAAEEHTGTFTGQRSCSLKTKPRIRAGHQRGFSALVGTSLSVKPLLMLNLHRRGQAIT